MTWLLRLTLCNSPQKRFFTAVVRTDSALSNQAFNGQRQCLAWLGLRTRYLNNCAPSLHFSLTTRSRRGKPTEENFIFPYLTNHYSHNLCFFLLSYDTRYAPTHSPVPYTFSIVFFACFKKIRQPFLRNSLRSPSEPVDCNFSSRHQDRGEVLHRITLGHFGPLFQTLTQFLLLHSEVEYISPAHFERRSLNEKYFHFPFASSFTGLRTAGLSVCVERVGIAPHVTLKITHTHSACFRLKPVILTLTFLPYAVPSRS